MDYNIICGDNVTALNKIKENTFDSCITDGPYGINIAEWDYDVPPVETWQAVYRTLKPGAFLLSFCSPELYHRMASAVDDACLIPKDMIFWIVTTKMAKHNKLKPAHEPMFVAQKPLDGTINNNMKHWGVGAIDVESARIPREGETPVYPTDGHKRRAFGGEYEKTTISKKEANVRGRYPSNIIGHFDDPEHQKYFYAPRVTRKERGEYNDHPTPKPINHLHYLCRVHCPKGGHVLDPFNGSGSTGIGALQEGREYTGIDLSQHYCDITEKRI